MKTLTPTQLRKDLYSILDLVIKSGRSQRIQRGKRTLVISVESRKDRIASLPRRNIVVGDSGDLVSLKVWEWNEEKNL